jgi:hypothetical protein
LTLAAFVLETATSYFAPAYSSLLPQLVDRQNVQEANGMIGAATDAPKVGGWAVAAGLLAFSPISIFFALNSLSFFLSALFIGSIRHSVGIASDGRMPPRLDEVFSALRPLSTLAAAVVALGLGVTISAGTWIAAVPEYVRAVLHREAGGVSILMVGYAGGSIAVGALLASFPVENKARASLLAWILYLPAYGVFSRQPRSRWR